MKNFCYLLFLLLFVSCEVYENQSQLNIISNDEIVVNKVCGRILDEQLLPIVNAQITIKDKIVYSDMNGVFVLNDVTINKNLGYVKVNKLGYFNASRSFIPNDGDNKLEIIMIDNTSDFTIPSGVQSNVSLSNGTSIKFDGAFQDESGNNYNGTVSISVYHLESSDDYIHSKMPGMLLAIDSNGNSRGLETFGMLKTELRGDSGQKLQIKNGHLAELKMKIDDNQLINCPETIPLWHFNEVTGLWEEEGLAIKQGAYYIGEVSHFSWWNYDAPFEQSRLNLTVKYSNNFPITNSYVKIIRQGTGWNNTQYGIVDSQGKVSGIVPKNEALTYQVWTNSNILIKSGSLGPYTSLDVIDEIIIPIVIPEIPTLKNLNINGNFIDCNNNVIQNGYIVFNLNNQFYYHSITNGLIDINIPLLNLPNNVLFNFYDYDNENFYNNMTINVINNEVKINSLPLCDMTEFISYKIDNNDVKIINSNIHFGINIYNQVTINAGGSILNFALNGQATGSGANALSSFLLNGTDFQNISHNSGSIQYNSSPIGPVGNFVDITFNGIYTDATGEHQLSGIMHVKRDL